MQSQVQVHKNLFIDFFLVIKLSPTIQSKDLLIILKFRSNLESANLFINVLIDLLSIFKFNIYSLIRGFSHRV